MPEHGTRLLAAIMFTDMVGYTALMQENEAEATLKRKRHRDVLQLMHEEFGGEILQYYGDGTLSIFTSAVYAVQCGIRMQEEFRKDPKVPLRIGLHLGDITYDDEGIYGNGVNVASRIESMGVAGAMLISNKLRDELDNHPEIDSISLGAFEFKNVKKPVELFAITNSQLLVPDRKDMKGKLSRHFSSVAVLPFKNMSSDPENEYFSDGITEEILNVLARIEGLQVTARTSSFAFKDVEIDIREIGKQLNVNTLLEGSVRKAGNKVRITAQLINAADGYHFWSETYDRELEDIFAVQDEVAAKIAEKLRQNFDPETRKSSPEKVPTTNMEAHNEYLLALHDINSWVGAVSMKSVQHLEKAISLDPTYTQAHALLSLVYGRMITLRELNPREGVPKMFAAAQKALSLDDRVADSFAALGRIKVFHEWDWEGAEELQARMLKLHPSDPWTYHFRAFFEFLSFSYDRSLEQFNKALALDPLNPFRQQMIAFVHYLKQDYPTVLSKANAILTKRPGYRATLELKAWALAGLERFEEAIECAQTLEPALGFRYHKFATLGYIHAKAGDTSLGIEYLQKLQSDFGEGGKPGGNVFFAMIHANLGNLNEAFEHMEIAIKNKEGDVFIFPHLSIFDPMKTDPRYQGLIDLFGFPEDWIKAPPTTF